MPAEDRMELEAKDAALARDLAAEERRESEAEEKRNVQLAMLLTTAEDDDDAEDIIEEFSDERGRENLLSGTPTVANESQGGTNDRRRRTRRRSVQDEVNDLIGSDDEDRAIAESIRMNVNETDGVTTRRGTVLGRKRRHEETTSVPLSRRRSKDAFEERNRRMVIDEAIEKTKSVDKSPVGPRRSKRNVRNSSRQSRPMRRTRKIVEDSPEPSNLRRSRRVRRTRFDVHSQSDDDGDNNEDGEEDSDSNMSQGSLQSSGSVGKSDAEAGSDVEVVEDSDPEENFDDQNGSSTDEEVKRSNRRGNRRSGRLNSLSNASPFSTPSRSAKKKKKKPVRKRRTNPKSVFEVEEAQDALTEQERKGRLEALVKQSENVAALLNEAMAGEKQRHDAKEKERKEANEKDANNAEKKEESTVDGEKKDEGDTKAEVIPAASPPRPPKKSGSEPIWPTGLGKEMQAHQVDGVRWLLTLDSRGLNAILADEMGLGKTIQSIAFLATVSLGENRGPHLVIAPKNVVPHWAAEFENFYPKKFKVITHVGAGEERFIELEANLRKYPDFDILVTSYDIAMRDLFTKPRSENGIAWTWRNVIRKMQKLEFEYAVVDEAHRLKNAESKFSLALRKYVQARRRLLLTGTPLSNNLKELWALLNVLNPRIFGSQAAFDEWFSAPFETSRAGLTNAEQSVIVDRLHTILRPFFRRRVRADVCASFASADEVIISCPPSSLQKAISMHYAKCRETRGMSANNTFQLLRQVANHPFTVCGALYDERELQTSGRLVSTSGKFLFLHYALPRLIDGGHRVLIFSQFRKSLDFLEDLCEMLGLKYGRLDGETDNEGRDDIVSRFNAEGSDIPVFLLTTRAGGVGLNLQTADTVILYDSDWNPSADLQAVSRIQRIGQKRTVHIMRLVLDGSIDECIVEVGREKMRTEAVAVGAGKFGANADPNMDAETRQKDLTAILEKYEGGTRDYSFLDNALAADAAKKAEEVTHAKIKEWEPQLLRVGEESLPEAKGNPSLLAVDSTEVPHWLRPEFNNLRSTTLALKCMNSWEVNDALQKGIDRERQNNGQLPSKRQRVQRFKTLFTSDDEFDDEVDSYRAPSADVESSTSEDIEFVESPGKRRPMSLPVSNPPNAASNNLAGSIAALMQSPARVQTGSSAAHSSIPLVSPSPARARPIMPKSPASRVLTPIRRVNAPVAAPNGHNAPVASETRVRTLNGATVRRVLPVLTPMLSNPTGAPRPPSHYREPPRRVAHVPQPGLARSKSHAAPNGSGTRASFPPSTPVKAVSASVAVRVSPSAGASSSATRTPVSDNSPSPAVPSVSASVPVHQGDTRKKAAVANGASSARRNQLGGHRHVAPRPANKFHCDEVIVIDSDSEKTPPAETTATTAIAPRRSGSRQGTMKEMREKAAKRKAERDANGGKHRPGSSSSLR